MIVPSRPFTWTVFAGAATFLSFSAADPERMASSMASRAMAGFTVMLGCGRVKDFGVGRTGGGGGGVTVEMGGGGGMGGVDFEAEEVETCAVPFTATSVFLKVSSSSAASDFIFLSLPEMPWALMAAMRADLSFSSST